MRNKTNILILLSLLIVLTVVNAVAISLLKISWDKQQEHLDTELMTCETRIETCQKYNEFQKAVAKIGRREWNYDNDCYVHSQDLVDELATLDIMSVVLINEGRDHAWVCPWIETVSGEFIGMETNLKIMEIRDKDRNVLCTCK